MLDTRGPYCQAGVSLLGCASQGSAPLIDEAMRRQSSEAISIRLSFNAPRTRHQIRARDIVAIDKQAKNVANRGTPIRALVSVTHRIFDGQSGTSEERRILTEVTGCIKKPSHGFELEMT